MPNVAMSIKNNQSGGLMIKNRIDTLHNEVLSTVSMFNHGVDCAENFDHLFEEAEDLLLDYCEFRDINTGTQYNFKDSLPILMSGLESIIRQVKETLLCRIH